MKWRNRQDNLAFSDMLMAPSRGGDFVEMAIKKLHRLIGGMDVDHHAKAHVHVTMAESIMRRASWLVTGSA